MFLRDVPCAASPTCRSYSVSYLGNVAGGGIVRYINLPIGELKVSSKDITCLSTLCFPYEFCSREVVSVVIACDRGICISLGGKHQYGLWLHWMAIRVDMFNMTTHT